MVSAALRACVAGLVVGVFSFAAAGGFEDALASLFVPNRGLAERMASLQVHMSDRFPFSVVAQLRGWNVPVEEVRQLSFNGHIGPFSVSLGYFEPVAEAIRAGFSVLIVLSTLWWVGNRLVPVLKI